MNNKKFFLDKLPQNAQKLFHSDPKLFQSKFQNNLNKIVKQDLFYLIKIATPVYERIHCSDWYDSWHKDKYWYYTTPEDKNTARKLLSIYGGEEFKSYEDKNTECFSSATNQELFKILRAIYFYTNYTKQKNWNMPHISPSEKKGSEQEPVIVKFDFVELEYDKKTKKTHYVIAKTKPELEQQIANGCENIANKLINTEIERICEINRQIKQAKEILAKYGTELIRGY